MNTEILINAIGNINDEFISEAETATKKNSHILQRVAAIVAVLIAIMFFQTEIGIKAIEHIKTVTIEFFESIFPDKDIPVFYEGTSEYASHSAAGALPDNETSSPGFVIYYNTERYEQSCENGTYYIRTKTLHVSREEIINDFSALLEGLDDAQKEAEIQRLINEREQFYKNLPASEIEIIHINKSSPEKAAEAYKNELKDKYTIISDTKNCENHNGVCFFVSQGNNWDSAMEYIYFIDDGNGGAYRLSARFFGEAAEGTGNRFRQMIDTFEIIK